MRIVIVAILLFIASPLWAGNLYVKNGGVKTTGYSTTDTWTDANCYGNLQAAIGQMVANDTLVIEDGIYTGVKNTIISGTNLQPPSGTSGTYTTIRARNYGKVILDGEGVRKLVNLNAVNYVHFDGIVFQNGGGGTGGELFVAIGASTAYAHHLKLTRCGFSEVPDTTGGSGYRWNLMNLRYYEYFLIEECYAWGNGKYRYYILDCRKGVLRRNVDRIDRSTDNDAGSYGNFGSVRLYNSNDILVQNHLLIDSDQSNQYLDPVSTNTLGNPAMFFSDGADTNTVASNNKVVGAIGVNNTGAKIWFHGGDADLNTDSIENSVFWGFASGLRNREDAAPDRITVSNSIFGYILGLNGALYTESGYGVRANNSAFYGNYVGIKSSVSDPDISSYNYFFNNTKNFDVSAVAGTGDVLNVNPLTSGLNYLPRIESNTTLKTANIGADVIYKIGVTGTIYGDTGYDTVTTDSLWPWPYEDVIKAQMSAYNLHGVNGARGFAAIGKQLNSVDDITLTSYIWEYLGNQMPTDVYGIVPGICGPSNGISLPSAPVTSLCSAGTPSEVTGTGPFLWTCAGSGGGSTASCGATLLEVPSGVTSAAVACPAIAGFR